MNHELCLSPRIEVYAVTLVIITAVGKYMFFLLIIYYVNVWIVGGQITSIEQSAGD